MQYTKRFEDLGKDDVDLAGGKGANLGELTVRTIGVPVPPGFVLTTGAYDDFVKAQGIGEEIVGLATLPPAADPGEYEHAAAKIRTLFSAGEVPTQMAAEIQAAYQALGEDADQPVAVRSSATAEDLAEASFAGQQETFLNVRGTDALLTAVKDCWASLWTARAMAYRARQGIDPAQVSLAVVVQTMVEAEAAGVMFTANPANGRRDEVVISTAWGLGESVVSSSVNTDDLVVDKESGRVSSRDVADKTVMTVYADHGTAERPVPEARRRQPVLDDEQAAELARYGARIEAHYGAPQDIEWALAEGRFFVLQARPITALPEPVGDVPTDWNVPDKKAFYVRASIVEQLPDPLSPLFADLAGASVPRTLGKLFKEYFGQGVLHEGDLGFPTVNGYAYYCYTRAAFWRMSLYSPAALRLLTGRGEGSGQRRWREYSHPRYTELVRSWQTRPLNELRSEELLAGVVELLDGGTEYYTSVQAIIPLAASSEVLFTWFYNRLVRRSRHDPAAQTFLLGFDSMPIRAEKSLYDLATWTREHADLAGLLTSTPPEGVLKLLRAGGSPAGVDGGLWDEWRSRFQAHLDHYGHTVYNLDFMNAVPADDPAPLLGTLTFYLRGDGTDPHERQRGSAARREHETAAVLARLEAPRRVVFRRLLRWAQSVAPVREDALADVGLAWPVMRRMLLELGRRLEDAGVIDTPADVFWLRRDEVQDITAAVEAGKTQPHSLAESVEQRKARWRGQKRVTPPQLLPKGTWSRIEGLMPAASEEQTGDTLRGVGASAGAVTAPARVLAGPEDFGQMRPGEVLVAAITTPAWTSLFAMASAVVTDVGGPLSHSSIVAREYGIPAVLGTAVATRRIQSGQTIRVDGDAGTVTLRDVAGTPADAHGLTDGPTDGPAELMSADAAGSTDRRRRAARVALAGTALALTAWRVTRRNR